MQNMKHSFPDLNSDIFSFILSTLSWPTFPLAIHPIYLYIMTFFLVSTKCSFQNVYMLSFSLTWLSLTFFYILEHSWTFCQNCKKLSFCLWPNQANLQIANCKTMLNKACMTSCKLVNWLYCSICPPCYFKV